MTEDNTGEKETILLAVKQKMDEVTWDYLTWSLPDLQDIAVYQEPEPAQEQEEPQSTEEQDLFDDGSLLEILSGDEIETGNIAPIDVPKTKLSVEEKRNLREFVAFDKDGRVSFRLNAKYEMNNFPAQNLSDINQKLIGFSEKVKGDEIRNLINEAFGYDLCSQTGFLQGRLAGYEQYSQNDLQHIVDTIDRGIGQEAQTLPEQVRYLAKILDDDNQNRFGRERISINPYILALTTFVEKDGLDRPQKNDADAKEDTYRAIIFAALLGKEATETQEGDSTEDESGTPAESNPSSVEAWAKREKTELTEEEFDALVPYVTMKEAALAAKELGEEYQQHAYNAFDMFKCIREEYKQALTAKQYVPPVETEETPETPSETEGNGSLLGEPETEGPAEESAE